MVVGHACCALCWGSPLGGSGGLYAFLGRPFGPGVSGVSAALSSRVRPGRWLTTDASAVVLTRGEEWWRGLFGFASVFNVTLAMLSIS